VTGAEPFRLFATVGTDHHRFDRLVEWVDRWLVEQAPDGAVEAIVQAGTSRPPVHAAFAGCLPFAEFRAALERADAVVCHGGPGTLVEAQRAGHRPLVVPRRPELDEHVDDHQVRFARRMAECDRIVLCDSYETLGAALGTLMAERARRDRGEADGSTGAVDRFAEIVGALIHVRQVPA
jgi:UDP-N-acetylglucosamine transferase subunit ALG13